MTESEFMELVKQYRQTVFRAAYCQLKSYSEAEDITQEVFLALYTYHGSFNDENHIKAWLLRVTVNKCRNLLKSAFRRFSVPLDEAADETAFTEDNQLLNVVMTLKPKLRTPLYMYYYEEYSVKEIAELLGEKETTITTRLSRGRQKLKELLTKEEKDELS